MITEDLLKYICRSMDVNSYNDLIPEIRSCITQRDNMFSNIGISESLETGKLVFDVRDREFGFVVGPISLVERDNVIKVSSSLVEPRRQIFLIVTKNNVKNNSESVVQDFRVRYIRGGDLIPLDVEKKDNSNGIEDLNKFCNSQCIMECGKDCILYKYKKK